MREQSIGMWEEFAGDLHERGVESDGRVEHVVHRSAAGASPFAGLVTRGAGFVLDVVLISVLLGIAERAGRTHLERLRPAPGLGRRGASSAPGPTSSRALYFVFFWSGAGRTPGMEVIGIRVRDPAGKPPSVRRAVVRALVMGVLDRDPVPGLPAGAVRPPPPRATRPRRRDRGRLLGSAHGVVARADRRPSSRRSTRPRGNRGGGSGS